jgi:hypothetical protein
LRCANAIKASENTVEINEATQKRTILKHSAAQKRRLLIKAIGLVIPMFIDKFKRVGKKWLPAGVVQNLKKPKQISSSQYFSKPVLRIRIRIRSDPDLFAGSGNFTTKSGSGSSSGSLKKNISVSVQYRAYVYLFTL